MAFEVVEIIKARWYPDGFNIGVNLGEAGLVGRPPRNARPT